MAIDARFTSPSYLAADFDEQMERARELSDTDGPEAGRALVKLLGSLDGPGAYGAGRGLEVGAEESTVDPEGALADLVRTTAALFPGGEPPDDQDEASEQAECLEDFLDEESHFEGHETLQGDLALLLTRHLVTHRPSFLAQELV